MAAAVRIDASAFTDPRFKILGSLIGSDRFRAIGCMAMVWSHCTEHQARTLSAEVIDALTDVEGFSESMVRAGLGERIEDGIRICGTKGRIEWLATKRKNARKGGEANRAKWGSKREPKGDPKGSRTGAEREPIGSTTGEPNGSPLTLALTLVPEEEKTIARFDFERLYESYPRKEGKKKGLEKAKAMVKTAAEYERLRLAIEAYAAKVRRERIEEKFVKHFATFMSCWEDYAPNGAAPAQAVGETEYQRRCREACEAEGGY